MKKMKLQDCCIFISDGDHQAPPKSDKGVPFITISNITTDNRIDFSNVMYVPLEYYEQLSEKSKAIKNDILYSVVGSFGKPVLIEEDRKFVFQRHIAILRPNLEKVIPEFLYYTLLNPQFYTVADYLAIGAAQRTISLESLRNIEIELPSLSQQKRIVDVIAPIDKKMHENAMINDYLEEMAKTIYDYWFVQFEFPNENGKPYKSSGGKMVWNDKLNLQIPNTWQSTELSSYGKIISGGTPSTENEDFYADDGIAWITPNDLSNNTSNMFISHGERDISLQGLNNSSATLIPSSSILLSTRAPIGYIAISMNELTTNQGFKTLVPNDTDNTSFLYYLIKRNIPYLEQMGTGTTFKEVSKDSMEHLAVILPSNNILVHFFQKIRPYIMLRKSYEQETKKLISIRNWLLPIVMNGQATIED